MVPDTREELFDEQRGVDNFSFVEKSVIGVYGAIAFGRLFPRRYAAYAAVLSVIVGWTAGMSGLLYFGFIESLSQPNMLASLTSLPAFVTFAAGVVFGIGVGCYVFFGLLAPADISSAYPTLKNPITHLLMIGGMLLIATAAFWLVTFLNSLSPILGFLIASLIVLYRYVQDSFWLMLGSSRRQVHLISYVLLTISFLIPVVAYLLGYLPSWGLDEWAVALVYGIVAYAGISAPASAASGMVEDEVRGAAAGIMLAELYAEEKAAFVERAPDDVSVDLETPPSPRSYTHLSQLSRELDIEALDQLVEAYGVYIDAYTSLDDLLEGSVTTNAATADETVETLLATLARNVHPSNYGSSSDALEAARTLESLVEVYTGPEGASLLSGLVEKAPLLEQTGPSGESLATITSVVESTPATNRPPAA
ncbi:hypothetical protein [Natronobiforma cellulositropha]|uniref:hypothetical protein n=1 Tax=Natronobiforma cellulositropha TaxID=1679076 RepID=UPI0021D5E6A6|nr:hypothetical protein [Natronobiforma cellulositropha]